MCEVDWSAEGDAWALLTLTWPGAFVGDPDAWKAQLSRLRLRWQRRFDQPMHGMWALEWQRPRPHGASVGKAGPHFHLVVALPNEVPLAAAEIFVKSVWSEIVAPGDSDHLEHGADVEEANVRTAPLYLAREMGKKRQKTLPPEWVATGAGRWWGVWGMKVAERPASALERHEFMQLRRAFRRLALRNTRPSGGYCDLRTRRIYMPLGSFTRGYEMRPRYAGQGGVVFSRGAPWALSDAADRYLGHLRGNTDAGSIALMDKRVATSLEVRRASLAGASGV